MTPEEIRKMAVELAKDWMEVNNLPAGFSNETLSGVAKEMKRVVCFILRTHCIVSKEEVRAMMSKLDNDIRTSDTLKFADTPTAQLQKGRMQGYSIGAKSALQAIFCAETFDETDK